MRYPTQKKSFIGLVVGTLFIAVMAAFAMLMASDEFAEWLWGP